VAIEVIDAVFKKKIKPSGAKLVAICLANYASKNDDGSYHSWPSYNTICAVTSLSKASVSKHLKTLQEQGIIKMSKRHESSTGYKKPNTYEWNLSELSKVQQVDLGQSSSGKRQSSSGKRQSSTGRPDTLPKPLSDPLDSPYSPPGDDPEKGFNEFWKVFDYELGEDLALSVWTKKGLSKKVDEIMEGAQAYVKSRDPDNKAFWKQAPGWLRDGRWKDKVEPAKDVVYKLNGPTRFWFSYPRIDDYERAQKVHDEITVDNTEEDLKAAYKLLMWLRTDKNDDICTMLYDLPNHIDKGREFAIKGVSMFMKGNKR